jgi:hypothetical protein
MRNVVLALISCSVVACGGGGGSGTSGDDGGGDDVMQPDAAPGGGAGSVTREWGPQPDNHQKQKNPKHKGRG